MDAKEFLNTDYEMEDDYPILDQENWDSFSPEQLEWLLNRYHQQQVKNTVVLGDVSQLRDLCECNKEATCHLNGKYYCDDCIDEAVG